MKVGDVLIIKAKVIDAVPFQSGTRVKAEIESIGDANKEDENKAYSGKAVFWVGGLDQPNVVVE